MVKDAGFKTNVLIGCFSTANYDICVYEIEKKREGESVCVREREREWEREQERRVSGRESERAFTATMMLFSKS